MIIELMAFLFGAAILYYFSPKVVHATSSLAKALEIDPLIIGLFVVSIGTSLPEITNSIISSLSGHGAINIGDSIGSSISQICLIFGLAILIRGKVKGERQRILFLGGCATLAAILGVSMITKGFLSRIDGLLLITSYIILLYFIRVAVKRDYFRVEVEEAVYKVKLKDYIWKTIYSLAGVIVGAGISVYMLIEISKLAGIPEFILSFFLMSLNTSIPEFFIALSAIKQKEYGIAIGNIFGSNIADITLSMGLGPVIAPNVFSGAQPTLSGLYLVIVTALITIVFARRQKIDRKMGALMVGLYFVSLPLLLL